VDSGKQVSKILALPSASRAMHEGLVFHAFFPARLAALAAACALGTSVQAQSIATVSRQAIRIIVPYAGGSSTVLGRVIRQRMQENWGQTVNCRKRPGAEQ